MHHVSPQAFPTVSTVVSLNCVSLCSSWGPRRSFRLSTTTLVASGQRCSAISRHGSQKVAARCQQSSRLLLTVHSVRVSEFGLDYQMDRYYFYLIAPATHTVWASCFCLLQYVLYIFRCVCSLIPVWLYVMYVFSCDKIYLRRSFWLSTTTLLASGQRCSAISRGYRAHTHYSLLISII